MVQVWKDLKRDKIEVNGTLYCPGEDEDNCGIEKLIGGL